jgi:hypothetical protein
VPEIPEPEFERWYGRWAPFTPSDLSIALAGIGVPWWIVGGWAVDGFTGSARDHADIDVAFTRTDLPAVLAHLAPDFCVWSVLDGSFRPLLDAEGMLPGSRQCWVRRDASGPWLFDIALTPGDRETWVSPRDDRLRLPLTEATFDPGDGIRYLRPEIVLLMKAKGNRLKDRADLEAILPRLEPDRRVWLRMALDLVHPGHPWIDQLDEVERS